MLPASVDHSVPLPSPPRVPGLGHPPHSLGLTWLPARALELSIQSVTHTYMTAYPSIPIPFLLQTSKWGESFPCHLLFLKVNSVFSISIKLKRRRGMRHKEKDVGNYSENILLTQIWSLWTPMRSLGCKMRPWKDIPDDKVHPSRSRKIGPWRKTVTSLCFLFSFVTIVSSPANESLASPVAQSRVSKKMKLIWMNEFFWSLLCILHSA